MPVVMEECWTSFYLPMRSFCSLRSIIQHNNCALISRDLCLSDFQLTQEKAFRANNKSEECAMMLSRLNGTSKIFMTVSILLRNARNICDEYVEMFFKMLPLLSILCGIFRAFVSGKSFFMTLKDFIPLLTKGAKEKIDMIRRSAG